MNELEKAAGLSEAAAPAPEVAESVNECVANSEVEANNDAETTEVEKDEIRRIHSLSKEELCTELKAILESGNMEAHREVTAMKQAFFNLKTRETNDQLQTFVEEGNDPADFSAEPDMVENEFKQLYADFKDRRAAYLEAEEARRAENLEKKKEIITRMEEIAGDIDNVNTKYPAFQQLQADFKEIKDVPASAETDIWKQFQGVVEHFYDNLKINKELRDFDFKRNLDAKRELIEEAKALVAVTDPVASFRALQGLHDQWRALGPVAKEIREEIWNEFKEASTVINKRHQDYFEQRKAQEMANEEAKNKLCEEIESISYDGLKTFSEWNATTDRIIDLQKQWKSYGFASRKANTALYARFRKACDDFFTAKTDFFNRAKEELNDNLAKKTALCEKAEALKVSADIKKATDEVVKLQAEWKAIGSVPRKLSDALWQRFTTACNYFFDERKRQNKERHAVENENLEKKRAIIAKLAELPKDGDRAEVMPQIKALQAEWQEVGFVPFKLKDKVFAEYREICDALYDAYNKREARQRMSNFRERVSEIKGDGTKVGRERDRLMRICDSRRNELKTIENNMGFFSIKSSAGNSMLRDMENKVKRIKEDIKELEQKIALLDKDE
jgi:archaellum component FlaC